MPDFIRWLLNEPIILLILIGWIFSMIGGVVQRAARKAQAEQAQRQRAGGEPPRSARPARRGPDPEEIAREIRRAMGLEREPSSPRSERPRQAQAGRADRTGGGIGGAAPPPRIDYDEVPRPQPTSFDERPRTPTVVYDEARPRRTLREEMAARDAAAATELGTLATRDAHLGEGVLGRRLAGRTGRARPADRPKAARPTRGLLNLARPASAIVAMEVLGPPIALRKSPLPHDV